MTFADKFGNTRLRFQAKNSLFDFNAYCFTILGVKWIAIRCTDILTN